MADPTFEAERLAELMRQVTEDMARYGEVTSTTSDALMKSKHGIANYTQGMNMAGTAVSGLAKAGVAAANAMYEGKKGAAAFNDSLTTMSTAITAAGAALALFVPVIGPLVAGLVLATTATIAYVKKSNEMADKLYGGFNRLGKAGAVGAQGLTGVFEGAKKLGLSMAELDGYVGMIGENSKDLALLSGSVYRGRQQFEDMGAAMKPFRESLFAAGFTQQDLNDASMQYLRLQTRIGAAQNLTVNQLADGARKYLVETDALTKLTGQSRKEQEEAIEAARSQQRFRAKLEEMQNSGDAQQIAAAKEMELNYKMLYARSKEAAQGYGDLTTGMIGTDAANKLTQSTQGEVLVLLDRQKRGMIDGIQAFQGIGRAVDKTTKEFNFLYQTGIGEEFLLKINEGTELGLAANRDLSEEAKKIREEQIKQGLLGGEAADKLAAQYGKNVKQQQDLNEKMEKAVFDGIGNALAITHKLGNVTDTLANGFTKLSNALNRLLKLIGLGEKEDKVAGNQKEIDEAQKGLSKAQQDQVNAKSEYEKLHAARETKFYAEKLAALRDEKDVIGKKEEIAKMEADIIKRAEDDYKLKQARSLAALDAGTTAQGWGIGRTDEQKQAHADMMEADKRLRELQAFGGAKAKKEARLAGAGAGSKGADASDSRFARQGTPGAAPATPAAPGAAPAASAAPAAPAAPAARGAAPSAPAATTAAAGPNFAPAATTAAAGPKKLEDLLQFSDKSGSRAAFEQLEPRLKAAVIAAAEYYENETLNKLQINSARRDPADQQRLWDETVKRGTPGIGPTGMTVGRPGTSLHELGHAVDIQNYKDPTALIALTKIAGLRQPYPEKDPVHFQFRYGGIATGPTGGYNARLHGAEAVIPLVNGSVPVSLTTKMDFGLDKIKSELAPAMQELITSSNKDPFAPAQSGMSDVISVFREGTIQTVQLVGLVAELLRAQKNQNDISERLLQVANN